MRNQFFWIFLILSSGLSAQNTYIKNIHCPGSYRFRGMLELEKGHSMLYGAMSRPKVSSEEEPVMAGVLRKQAAFLEIDASFNTVRRVIFPDLGDYSYFGSMEKRFGGGYILAGQVGFMNGEPFVMAVDESNRSLWVTEFGKLPCIDGKTYYAEKGKIGDVQVDEAGNVFVFGNIKVLGYSDGASGGRTRYPRSMDKLFFAELDAEGGLKRAQLWGNSKKSATVEAMDFIRHDEGYVLVGSEGGKHQRNFAIVGLNQQLDSLQTIHPSEERSHGLCALQTKEGRLFVGGRYDTWNRRMENCFVMEVSGRGDTLWSRRFGIGKGNEIKSMVENEKGEIVILASVLVSNEALIDLNGGGDMSPVEMEKLGWELDDEDWRIALFGLDKEGTLLWKRGLPSQGNVHIRNFYELADGYLILSDEPKRGKTSTTLVRTDAVGRVKY